MHRRLLHTILDGYATQYPTELPTVQRIRALITAHERCFHRDCWPGHITGSAFVLDATRQFFLLHHHKKLNKWLQFGGHSDGDSDPAAVALREAMEESGLRTLTLLSANLPDAMRPILPVDIDVHVIPARGVEPEHEHHDLRYAFVAAAGEVAALSDESLALRWFPVTDLERVVHEEGLLRLARKCLFLAR